MATADRRAARTERLRAAAAKEEATHKRAEVDAMLGDVLATALMRYLAACKPERVMPVERAMALIGYSDELKKLIVRCIEVNPAMEESFLLIAELAYRDGEEAQQDSNWENYSM